MKSLWIMIAGLAVLSAVSPLGAKKNTRVEEGIRIPDTANIQVITFRKGAALIGRISSITGDQIVFSTDAKDTVIFIPDIGKIEEIPKSNIRNGKYWYPDPNSARLYLVPTARPLPKGEGFVSGYYIIAPLVAYGVSDNISISGGGTFLLSTMIGGVYLLPKIGFSFGNYVSLAAGAAGAKAWGPEGFAPSLGALYALGTFGPPEMSATVGAGYAAYMGTTENDTAFSFTPAFMVGGSFRILRKMAFVTENYMVKNWLDYSPIVTYGLRFFGEQFTLDVAFINTINYGGFSGKFPGLPVAAITYKF